MLGPVFVDGDLRPDPALVVRDPRSGPVFVKGDPRLGGPVLVVGEPEYLPCLSLDENVGCESTLLSRANSLCFSGSASSKVISLVCSSLAILSRMRKSKGI